MDVIAAAFACTSRQRRQQAKRGGDRVVSPSAIVGLAAVTDLHAAFTGDSGGGAVRGLLGGSPGERPERYANASPIQLLPHGTRQLLLHGLRDEDVPIAQSRSYARAATLAGDDVECIELEDADHMDFLDPGSIAHASLCARLEGHLHDDGTAYSSNARS